MRVVTSPTHIHESCPTYVWVMSHICMSHVTYKAWAGCVSWHHLRISMSHVAHVTSPADIHESCRTYAWVMSHICMSHVISHMWMSFFMSPVMSHIWMSHGTQDVTHMPSSWRLRLGVCRDIIYMSKWVMSHIWMSHVMPHVWMSHVPHMNESCPTYEWVMSHIWMSTHMKASCHINRTYRINMLYVGTQTSESLHTHINRTHLINEALRQVSHCTHT